VPVVTIIDKLHIFNIPGLRKPQCHREYLYRFHFANLRLISVLPTINVIEPQNGGHATAVFFVFLDFRFCRFLGFYIASGGDKNPLPNNALTVLVVFSFPEINAPKRGIHNANLVFVKVVA
jgi:hypothetical protein